MISYRRVIVYSLVTRYGPRTSSQRKGLSFRLDLGGKRQVRKRHEGRKSRAISSKFPSVSEIVGRIINFSLKILLQVQTGTRVSHTLHPESATRRSETNRRRCRRGRYTCISRNKIDTVTNKRTTAWLGYVQSFTDVPRARARVLFRLTKVTGIIAAFAIRIVGSPLLILFIVSFITGMTRFFQHRINYTRHCTSNFRGKRSGTDRDRGTHTHTHGRARSSTADTSFASRYASALILSSPVRFPP